VSQGETYNAFRQRRKISGGNEGEAFRAVGEQKLIGSFGKDVMAIKKPRKRLIDISKRGKKRGKGSRK